MNAQVPMAPIHRHWLILLFISFVYRSNDPFPSFFFNRSKKIRFNVFSNYNLLSIFVNRLEKSLIQ